MQMSSLITVLSCLKTFITLKKVLILFLLTSLIYGLGTLGLHAHDWYPAACCSGVDCHPIASCSELTEGLKGTVDWGKYHFQDFQVHPSLDNQCHVCIHPYTTIGEKPM